MCKIKAPELIIAVMFMNLYQITLFRIWIVIVCCGYSSLTTAEWESFSFDAMGTRFELELWASPPHQASTLYKTIELEIDRLEHLWSPYIPSSDISKINAQSGQATVQVREETYRIIKQSISYSMLSNGAFDISFASVGKHYDYRAKKQPEDSARGQFRELIDYRSIQVTEKSKNGKAVYFVKLPNADMAIDLGGIAKGYAVDRVAEILLANGIESAAISLGGDSRFIGDRGPSQKTGERLPWIVAIKHPRKTTPDRPHALRLPLSDSAFSTSGDYERYFINDAGERVHHIIDTKTGLSASQVVSVSVLGEASVDCDALSTTIFTLGVKDGLSLIEKRKGFDAIIIDRNGKVHYSSGLVE